jgi:hypothetical protein
MTPGSEIRDGQKSRSGSEIRDKHPGSYFRELGTNFSGKKYLKYLMPIWNLFEPGSRMEKFGSGINIPDPHH